MTERLDGLDLNLIQALDALLREGNITRAARAIGISQPAMSARLNRLREIFSDKLFVPAIAGRGVIPTPRAEALQPQVSEILERLRWLTGDGAAFAPATSRRTFTVAMHDNPAMIVGPELVARLVAAAPFTRVLLVEPDVTRTEADMEAGRIDLMVAPESRGMPGWIARPLMRERFVTAQRRNHPRGTKSLDVDTFCALDHLLISAGDRRFTGLVDDALNAIGRSRRVAVSIESYALAPFIVEASDLLCTLPERLLGRLAATLDLFDPPFILPSFGLSAFWHPRNQDDPGHGWLREQVVAATSALRA